MSKRKSYDVSFKVKAVECAEKKSKEAAAREMGVDSKRIREWCKQKVLAILKKKGTSSRKRQGGAWSQPSYVSQVDSATGQIVVQCKGLPCQYRLA